MSSRRPGLAASSASASASRSGFGSITISTGDTIASRFGIMIIPGHPIGGIDVQTIALAIWTLWPSGARMARARLSPSGTVKIAVGDRLNITKHLWFVGKNGGPPNGLPHPERKSDVKISRGSTPARRLRFRKTGERSQDQWLDPKSSHAKFRTMRLRHA